MDDLKKRSKIIDFLGDGESFVLAVKTDIHYCSVGKVREDGVLFPATDLQKGYSSRKTFNTLQVDAICDLGDIVRGYEFDTLDILKKDFSTITHYYTESSKCPVYFVAGNHDNGVMWAMCDIYGGGDCTLDEVFMPSERYGIIMPQMKKTAKIADKKDKLYYYSDCDNVRIIALDTNDVKYEKVCINDIDINHHAISDEQIDWFENKALKTDLPVVILAHCPLVKELHSNPPFPDNKEKVLDIISKYKNNGGEVVAVLSGHCHMYGAVLCNGINHIMFPNGYEHTEIFAVSLKKRKIKVLSLNSDEIDYESDF